MDTDGPVLDDPDGSGVKVGAGVVDDIKAVVGQADGARAATAR